MTEDGSGTSREAVQTEAVSAFSAVDKIPPFWKKDPELWFCQIEAVFNRANITSGLTKFYTIIPNIDFDVLEQASDIVKRPSETPYEDIKARLVNTYEESESKRIQQLLEGKHLGDERPSQLLRRMKQLAGGAVADGIIKTVWLRALSQNLQAILISTEQKDINKLADIADQIQEVTQPGEVYTVTTNNLDPITGMNERTKTSLEETIERLSREVAALSAV
nr:uncharacterized protein LOC112210068 [Halyomorpha halys]